MNRKIVNVSTTLASLAVVCSFLAPWAAAGAGDSGNSHQPDPLALLQMVAHARQQIRSGKMELEVIGYDFSHPQGGTNRTRLKIVFDGDKRRFESWDREYSYVLMGPDAAAVTDAKMRQLGLNNEAAVAAGLLTAFESHHVTAYDGSALMDYWEAGRQFQTDIEDPAKGSVSFMFDPRCLGLQPNLFADATVADYLSCSNAESVTVTNALVGGAAAWHVRILSKFHMASDFWIDAANPMRLLKSAWNGDEAISRYDAAHADDPIPVEVVCVIYSGPERSRSENRFVRRSARFNVPVDPIAWMLAGLQMKIGTEVSDDRIHRSLGYWNGSGLSQNFPRGSSPAGNPANAPSPEKLLALAEQSPQSAIGLDAAKWVVLNMPDGPQVERAENLIRQYHSGSTNLVDLCDGLEDLQHRSAVAMLRAVIETNRDAGVRAHACFSLATILKSQSNDTGSLETASDAARMFERVVNDYGHTSNPELVELADRAAAEIFELQRLAIGKTAPDIRGADLDGHSIKLSNYRGKVVVLVFWGTWCSSCMAMVPDERDLVQRMAGKPFALIGVNSDDDMAKARRAIKQNKMTWPSFRDGSSSGPIAKAWNVQSWPTVYVLDRNGVIRYRDLRGEALDKAVGRLVQGLQEFPAQDRASSTSPAQ